MRKALDIQIVRPFNQLGPGMPKGLLVPDLLERIACGESPLRMRGRDDRKDFLDWRDAMDAYVALLGITAPSGSAWNFCSGREVRVSALVKAILAAMGLATDVHFADPSGEASLGDPSKLMAATGWRPRRSLDETIAAILAG
jgi:nucleoside-diphosphate-sugar epimerase